LPRDGHRHWARALRATFRLLERGRRGVPRLNELVRLLGSAYWDLTVERGLAGVPARYELPDRLAGTAQAATGATVKR
jgi:hypothetical protein